MINTADPDIRLVRGKVAEAIARAEGDSFFSSRPPPEDEEADKIKKTPALTGGSLGSLSSGYVANESEDVDSGVLSAS